MACRSLLRLERSLVSKDDGTEDSEEGERCGHTAQEDMCRQVSAGHVIVKVDPRAKLAGRMAGWHESGLWGRFATTLMWWFADRRHDKNARDDVDLNMAAKWKLFCGAISLD